MIVHLGWWLIPLFVTIAAFSWRSWFHLGEVRSSGYGSIGQSLGYLITFLTASSISLLAWLVWAILR